MNTENTTNNNWIKVQFSYIRKHDLSQQTDYSILNVESITFKAIKEALANYFKCFSGKGKVIINLVVTNRELTEKEVNYFENKCYTFNNQ